MKKKWTLIICMLCIAALCFSGCGASSKIEGKPFDVDGAGYYRQLLSTDLHGFAFYLQDDIKGQVMSVEVWQNGSCTDNYVLWNGGNEPKTENEYYYGMEQLTNDDYKWIGMELTGLTYSSDGKTGVQARLAPIKFTFPELAKSYGFQALGDTITVEPGNEYILAFWDIEQSNGFKTIDLDMMNFSNYRETIQDCDYIILLKMQLFDSEEEAYAAADEIEEQYDNA